MTSKRLRDLRQNGKAAWGVHLSFLCPELIEFCGHLGFEWLFLDAEHQPLNASVCRDLVRAADVMGLPCLVRVAAIRPDLIEGFLDVGVAGILAPNVRCAADARALVAAVKFPPDGERGAAAKARAANYGLTQSPAEYVRRANQHTVTVALIETQGGLDDLSDIMSVPGLDYIAIGPNDLGLSMGIEGGMADPRVQAVVERAQARMRETGMPQLTVVMDADQGRKAAEAGAQLIAVSDAALLAGAGRSFLEAMRR